jgi:hypothetical protein
MATLLHLHGERAEEAGAQVEGEITVAQDAEAVGGKQGHEGAIDWRARPNCA